MLPAPTSLIRDLDEEVTAEEVEEALLRIPGAVDASAVRVVPGFGGGSHVLRQGPAVARPAAG